MGKTVLFIIIGIMLNGLASAQSLPEVKPSAVHSGDGVLIRFDNRGKGKPALVFVHGWTCNREFWKYQVNEFAKNHQIVTLDLAGHGESGVNRENWTMAAFGEDVVAVVNALKLKDVILIGHSMGGPVIAEAAGQLGKTLRGVIGVDTWHNLAVTRTPESKKQIIDQLKNDYEKSFRAAVRQMFVASTDTLLSQWILSQMLATPKDIMLGAGQGILDWGKDAAAVAFSSVKGQVLAINTDTYIKNNPEGSQSVVPSFQMEIMKGYGHFLMMEDPVRFNALLSQTIAGMPKMINKK